MNTDGRTQKLYLGRRDVKRPVGKPETVNEANVDSISHSSINVITRHSTTQTVPSRCGRDSDHVYILIDLNILIMGFKIGLLGC